MSNERMDPPDDENDEHDRDEDDRLSRATRALRDDARAQHTTEPVAARPWQVMDGWARVAQDLRRSSRRRRMLVVAGLQLLVALAGVGAWAAVSGRLPSLLAAVRSGMTAPPVPAPRPHRRAVGAPATTVEPANAPAPAPAPTSTPTPTPPSNPTLTPGRLAPPPLRRQVVALAPPGVPAPEALSPDELYEAAHRAHFARRDYAAALAAWDRYLALGPATFTPEARYNRAIALVRLGRREEAAAALKVFLERNYGGYRLEEAQALLRMLKPPP